MKSLWLIVLLSISAVADPARLEKGPWSLEAEPLEERRARLKAQWEQARGESATDFWRASLEDNKVDIEVGGERELGIVQTEYSVEQEWQEELQSRRARISLSVPQDGWEAGVSTVMDWQSVEDEDWAAQPARLRGWLSTPEWQGWRALASWEQTDQQATRGLALTSTAGRKLEAEMSTGPNEVTYVGRMSQRMGPGTLTLEASDTQGEHWDHIWTARYQCRLTERAKLAAQGSRRWSDLLSTFEDKVEARLEVHF